jgi:hypothetical protein
MRLRRQGRTLRSMAPQNQGNMVTKLYTGYTRLPRTLLAIHEAWRLLGCLCRCYTHVFQTVYRIITLQQNWLLCANARNFVAMVVSIQLRYRRILYLKKSILPNSRSWFEKRYARVAEWVFTPAMPSHTPYACNVFSWIRIKWDTHSMKINRFTSNKDINKQRWIRFFIIN